MAKVQGIKEKLHSPLYDAFLVPAQKTFSSTMTDPRMIRFFVDVQNKTKLETNLQASGVLPSQNAFEARAMRVVVSGLSRTRIVDSPEELRAPEQLEDLLYNSITSLIVGEKIMIEMPTFFFPGAAGVYSAVPSVANHGVPDPKASFVFAEPVPIDPSQNFRVEMLFPQGVPGDATPPNPRRLAGAEGPFRIWVILDGFLTRDVQ